MATKTLYATGTFKYQNRMMKAGDPVEMTDPHRRLYTALGKVTEEAPKKAPAPKAEETVKAVEARKPKRAPRKKKAAAKK